MKDERTAPLLECVPNFSEGRDPAVVAGIVAAIRSVEAVRVLHVDVGAGANRTVVTFVGEPEAVCEAAFRGIREAVRRIDLNRHGGEHPRIGAADVCPLIPLAGLSRAECAQYAERLGRRIGEELKLPVILYEESATHPDRKDLGRVRRGGFEGLAARMANDLVPDFGPHAPHPTAGAVALGVRKLLVAFNVNLDTTRVDLAQHIAARIRERSKIGHRLKGVKALGWWMPEYGHAQVTCNLTDYEACGLLQVFRACEAEAQALGVRVTGSELIGLVPQGALRSVGETLARGEGSAPGEADEPLLRAVRFLGLGAPMPFDLDRRVLERTLLHPPGTTFRDRALDDLVSAVASTAPVPGGGTVAAWIGLLGAALAAKVEALRPVAAPRDPSPAPLTDCMDQFRDFMERDADAYLELFAVWRRPRDEPGREEAVRRANALATKVPFQTLQAAHGLQGRVTEILTRCRGPLLGDAIAAALAAEACASMALCQIVANARESEDPEATTLLMKAVEIYGEVATCGAGILGAFLASAKARSQGGQNS